jgi:3-hydroxyisobutyrate dehydrogenase-like beta-hydroxyacid dehydrogenase
MRVGFIGIGHMGRGMALSLIRAGHEISVYNRTRSAADALASEGAIVAADVADACTGDAVFTMLSNDEAVEAVVFGAGGVLETLRPGAIHISSSTISVDLSERLESEHGRAQQRYVSAPVLGRPDKAEEGELFVISAGEPSATRDAEPLFDAIGQRTISFGERASTANLVKLSANFLIATVFEALGEAIALVDCAGLDKQHYVDFLTSTLFGAPVYKTYGALVAADELPPVGFAAPLGFKDIRLALAAAEKLRVPMPFGSVLHERFVELLANGGESMDWSAVGRMARRDAGEQIASSARETEPAQ